MGRAIQVESLWNGITNNSGVVLGGGKVYTYEPGTTTPKSLYQDQAKTVTHANPLVLNSAGKSLAFADGGYKFIIKTSADVTVDTWDNLLFGLNDNDAAYGGATTGSANAYAITTSPARTAYAAGMTLTFVANHTNTGASTLNVDSLGAKAIRDRAGNALTGGELVNGTSYQATDDGTNFRVNNFQETFYRTRKVQNAVAGSANAYTITTGQSLLAYSVGQVFWFIANHTNNGAATLNVDTLGAKDLRKHGSTALVANDLISGHMYHAYYDGTNMVLSTSSYPKVNGINLDGQTASQALYLDASKNIVSQSAATFRGSISAAASGANSDITAITGVTRTTWTPSGSASGSMTVSSVTVNEANYQRYGGYIEGLMSLTFTLGGTASNIINFSHPTAGTSHDNNAAFPCSGDENATGIADLRWRYDGTNLILFKAGLGNFTLGASASVHVAFRYKI